MKLQPASARNRGRLLAAALLIVVASVSSVSPAVAQRLAQRNWQGSGLTAQTWWPRATFCSLDLRTDRTHGLSGVSARLEEFQAIGCEALVLDILNPATTSGSPVSLSFGTLEDADTLIEQMGRRKMRLILNVTLDSSDAPASKLTLDRMRFWLSRGIAGFLLRKPGESSADHSIFVHQAHQLTASSLGTRVLLGDGLPVHTAAETPHRLSPADLQLALRRLPAGHDRASIEALRTVLSASSAAPPLPVLALDESTSSARSTDPQYLLALHHAQAAILLGHGAAAMLPLSTFSSRPAESVSARRDFSPDELRLWIPEAGDPLGPTPQQEITGWLRSLNDLRHSSQTLRTGFPTYLDLDLNEFLVWIVRPKGSGVPLLFVCNLSSSTSHVSLTDELRLVGIQVSSLRTILSTDPTASQPATVDDIGLASGGVLVGELR